MWHNLATERWGGRHGIYGGNWRGPVFVVHLVPLLLGGGTPMFGPGLERVRLEPLYAGQSPDATDLRFSVVRDRPHEQR